MMGSTSSSSSTAASFGDTIADWTMDQTVGWLLDLADSLHQRESFMIHLVQNEYDGPKLTQLFRTWQWERERGGDGGKLLTVKGRPRDITFDEEDSETLYQESLRLCGCGWPFPTHLMDNSFPRVIKNHGREDSSHRLNDCRIC